MIVGHAREQNKREGDHDEVVDAKRILESDDMLLGMDEVINDVIDDGSSGRRRRQPANAGLNLSLSFLILFTSAGSVVATTVEHARGRLQVHLEQLILLTINRSPWSCSLDQVETLRELVAAQHARILLLRKQGGDQETLAKEKLAEHQLR